MHIRNLTGCHKVIVLESYDAIKKQTQQIISVQDVVQGTCPAQDILSLQPASVSHVLEE